ncbi:hypothetical protein ACEWY4_009068 [Coilia grayii]|uniref:C2 domain-containing protein n=1 Tax=Coilia grayii TaxID=363190 RepID=A0ABD1K5D9_9TELE
MSFLERVLAFFGLGDIQWLFMVTLFIASVVTLMIYFVQYYLDNVSYASEKPVDASSLSEANALLSWALSLQSWKAEWRKAWVRALNDNSKLTGNSFQLTFQENGLQSTDLVLSQVSGFRKSAGGKMMRCQVFGEKLQFTVGAQSAGAVSREPQQYTVTIAPLQLQLDLQLTEASGEVRLNWGLLGVEALDMQLSPTSSQGASAGLSTYVVRERLRQVLCRVRPSAVLSSHPAQPEEMRDARGRPPQVVSPPKPPRAHEWKLLVKNIRVTCSQEGSAAGSMSPQCVLQLNDPPQRQCTSVLKHTHSPSWDQPFIFELNGRSKELNIQLVNTGNSPECCLLGQVSVPFDLVKKHPKGQQTFALTTKDVVAGTLTTEFTYLEPSEVRTWQTPTPAASKRVEMDRTVMPCGTVVTTVTAVKSKPGRALPPGLMETPMKPPTKAKMSQRRVSEQPSMLTATVSKALSSSDTELLMLNGTDPVAEAAIRQLQESARQKLKSPVKKSTIIISGVTKAPLSQDEELALMAGYAAAMDASLSQGHEETPAAKAPNATLAIGTGAAAGELNPGPAQLHDPLEGPSNGPMGAEAAVVLGVAAEDWESQTGEGEDPDADKASLSLCMSESGLKKGRGSFLHKGAKLFFRRRHQRKDPGMSQSHNDLVYLEQPEQANAAAAGERQRRTATLRRIINRKLLHRAPKSQGNGCAAEPSA